MAPDLQPTGERLLPEHYRGQLVHAEHLARYRWVSQLAAGHRVLDAACGEGYGSALMAGAGAAGVTGVDIDRPTAEHVRERYGIDAHEADVCDLPFDDGAFDLVVSFETIEHVEQPERALDELARVLAAEGVLAISTPVAGQYQVANEFHVREFEHDEFAELLKARFASVQLLFQHNWVASAVLGEHDFKEDSGADALALETTKVRGLRPGAELYLVALCGAQPVETPGQTAVLAGTEESHDLAHRLDDAVATQERYREAYEAMSERTKELDRQLTTVLESRSWRLTRPLRERPRLRRR